MDSHIKTIYLFERIDKVFKFKLYDDNQFEFNVHAVAYDHDVVAEDDDYFMSTNGKTCMVLDELDEYFHIIGGNGHYKYYKDTNQLKLLHKFKDNLPVSNIKNHSLVRISRKLLVFGGRDSTFDFNSIHEYSIDIDKWRSFANKTPVWMQDVSACVVLNGEYVVFFDGPHDIIIYSVKENKFETSLVKSLRKETEYQAFAVNNTKKDTLATHGFVRIHWNDCGLKNVSFPPEYLINIINKYNWNEYIHLIDRWTGFNYKIDVFDIIQSINILLLHLTDRF